MPFFPPPSLKAMNTILINILNTYLGILPKNNGRLPRKLFYFKGLFLSCGSIYRFWYEPLSALSVHFYTLFKNFIDLTSAAEGSGVYYRKRLDTSTKWWPISFVSLWYLKNTMRYDLYQHKFDQSYTNTNYFVKSVWTSS